MKKILSVSFLILSFSSVFGQSYPDNREKFIKYFKDVLATYIDKKEKDFIKDELEVTLLETTDFPNEYFQQMIATCNLMETKRLKPFPEIYNYVYSVYSFVKNKQPSTSFDAWHSSVDKLLDARNIKKFEDFIELSAGFFSVQKIAESSNFQWYFYGSYVFEFTDKPIIRLTNGRLVCGVVNKDKRDRKDARFIDSLSILNTSGTYDPVLKKWEGKGGRITWEKVGLKATETFADLKKVELSMKSSTINLDSVMLTTPYFDKPILGKLTDRAFVITREQDAIYPQFLSNEKRLTIKDIRPEMNYDGGFSLQGASFVGIGTAKEPARLYVMRNGKNFIRAESQYFTVAPKKILAQTTAVSMYFGEGDSLIHPGLEFIYSQEKDQIELTRGKNGVSQAPFSDSYHKLDWYVQKLTWIRKSTDIVLTYDVGTSQENRVARLESKDFYDGRLYDQLQGLEQNHPLVAISNYCYKYDIYTMDEGKIASAMNKTIEQAKSIILDLSGLGFLSYDSESKIVKVNQKTLNFVQSRAGKRDYDNLQFVSDMRPKKLEGYTEEQMKENKYLQDLKVLYEKQTEERRLKNEFGVFSLSTQEIKLDAVDRVKLSDAQAAFVLPDKSQVTVKKNRDFEFTGWASVGKLETHTLSANYTYETNVINLLKTDKTLFRVKPLAQADGNIAIATTSSISGITGEILIDDPKNRSGYNKTIPDYPKLKSTKATKVYYNSRDIYRGAYDSVRFYFTCEPFEMDSLDNFKEQTFRLKGELTSGGIFPIFKEELKIMPDYSFGFSTKAPAGGYDFYSTKAKYENKIVLSNNGLQGAGKIEFVQSTSISKAFTFLPDSTIGFAEFSNKPIEVGVQFPDVNTPEAFITYVPKKNILKAASTPQSDMVFFGGEAKLKGTAIVQPTGMTGYGIMNLEKANLGSDKFRFKRYDIDADTAIFNLKGETAEDAVEGEGLAVKTENVQAHVSFKDRKGEFKSNNGESTIAFPQNQYVCKMDFFTWLMDRDEVEMESGKKQDDINISTDLDLVGPNFFSVNPKQDSLQFRAPKATFSIKGNVITCSKTEYIDVADARIYPDSMKVIIRRRAKMDPLKNSKIVANFITKYHVFTSAITEINARRNYTAVGDYPYYDADSNVTLLRMDNIGVDSSYQTYANGNVRSDAGFKLSPQFDYYGKIGIKAANPAIFFVGATRINHDCAKFTRSFLAFNAQIDPKNIQIPVSQSMKTLDNEAISAGIVWHDSRTTDSIRLYPTFLSKLEASTDPILITASGLLQYDPLLKEFQIGSKEKLNNRGEKGNFVALQIETCSLNGEGNINLGMDYGEVTVDAVGTVEYDNTTGQTSMNTTLRLNLKMDQGVFESVAERIVANEGAKPLDFNSTTLSQAVLEWQDQKAADKLKEDYTLASDKKIKRVPDALEKSIVLTGVRLKSRTITGDQDRGLVTSVEGAAIVNMYGKPVMRQVVFRSFFQQIYSANGDHFAILMQVPGGPEYLFDYAMQKKDGLLSIGTGDAQLTAGITAIKPDKRKSKNFDYEVTSNQVYLAKLMRLFE